MSIILAVILSSFVFSLILSFIGQKKFESFPWIAPILPLSLFIYFCSFIKGISEGQIYSYSLQWVPSLGVNLDFRLDSLALLFSLLITGIGTLVFTYTLRYMRGNDHLLRFYIYLSVFMGAMLGLVNSNNLISLFIFWELTSISSFFLISFKNRDKGSRQSALTALGITGLGGLCLLAFSVMAGQLTGTFSISEMLGSSEVFTSHPWSTFLLIFLILAAFTKSAQFPFHFWLPGAMKAPTPVSTYLHSATMVKAGIYLLLRFTPHFSSNPDFHSVLITFGGITMLYGGFHLIFRKDLKGILAYSTIGALGILVFLTGIGTPEAITAAVVFIIVHALYKATLFLIAGSIDSSTGTRDITRLSGMRKILPILFIAGLLAAISSAGIPPSIGFVGKDLIYEATLHNDGDTIFLTTLAVIANIFMVWGGFLVGMKPFTGKLPDHLSESEKLPVIMWATPLFLAICGIIAGLFPWLVDNAFSAHITENLTGNNSGHLKLWHGFNLILLLSFLTISIGLVFFFLWKPGTSKENFIQRFSAIAPKEIMLKLVGKFEELSLFLTRLFQNGYLRRYVMVLLVILTTVLGLHVFSNPMNLQDMNDLKSIDLNEIIICGIMLAAILFTIFINSRLAAVAGLGIVGYAMCFIFVFYGAPDLAMTQFTIDTLTVILFVLVLYRLPKYLRYSNPTNRIRDGIIATTFGTFIALIILEITAENPVKNVTEYYAENAYTLAKGKNIVNVILVDFRGFDTMIEIIVLSVAAIGVFALLKLYLKKHEK
ncbi:MAG: hydrogen gas-evolving membrane-bound hydrogenase subunit E [Brumimicrobium sp.]|nr:hydrogen gas-evolving membrane-bound hydrogenase subunit E [Brumimicrobium sp.]